MKHKRTSKRNVVELFGFDRNNRQVVAVARSVNDYYSQLNPLLDRADFRKEKRIVRVVGVVFDSTGRVEERFENAYSPEGEYLHGKSEYSDGSVQQD